MRVLFYFLMMAAIATAGEIRVVSYNIHHGVGMDGKLDLKRIAEVIKKEKPDFVALQEVDNKASRSGEIDQAAVLAKMLGMHHAFGKCIDLGGGGYGNAVLSKYPLLKAEVHKLPGGGEARAVMEVIIEKGGKKLSFASVHLDWGKEEVKLAQAQALQKELSTRKHPVVLLGDFNSKPESQTMKFLAETWTIVPKTGDQLTSPANKPRSEIDFVLTLGLDASKATCKVINEPVASDHRPIAASIQLP